MDFDWLHIYLMYMVLKVALQMWWKQYLSPTIVMLIISGVVARPSHCCLACPTPGVKGEPQELSCCWRVLPEYPCGDVGRNGLVVWRLSYAH